jgi:redox-sensitive bicupin YhaK (pirin superfamily)
VHHGCYQMESNQLADSDSAGGARALARIVTTPPSGGDAVVFAAGASGARLVLYAGLPIGEPLVHHGPFVAGSLPEIAEQYRRFRTGQFPSMKKLVQTQQRSHA